MAMLNTGLVLLCAIVVVIAGAALKASRDGNERAEEIERKEYQKRQDLKGGLK